MRIAQITDGKAGRCVIRLENGMEFPIGRKEKKNLELEEGKELGTNQLQWIMEELVYPRGRNYLIHLLASKDYTISEIEEKLRKTSYPDIVIEQIIHYGIEQHYLDDARYAEDYIRFHREGKSIRSLKYKLREKGIPDDILNGIEEEDEEEFLYPMVKKYWEKKKGDSYVRRGKTTQYFVRKGYPFDLVRRLITRLEEERIV
ncbi:MAG: RecX family transcriptional regulator [Lachnospiraceae bacterium]|nr:RecX family transcriptional regulator [Lachnospiraceae bacterium]